MAIRRRRTFRRRGMKRAASAFAPAKSGGGHLDWEASGTTCWSIIDNVFPLKGTTYGITCDGAQVDYQTMGLVLIPLNEARGTITLLRVRGYLGCANSTITGANQDFLRRHTVHWMLQLVPRDPDLVTTPAALQLLSGNKSADQESNRIIMQWVSFYGGEYGAQFAVEDPIPPAAFVEANTWFREIDVRTKRRFLRAQWALVLSATTVFPESFEENRVYANFRMLFRADDGI